jgi:hypothetical protein
MTICTEERHSNRPISMARTAGTQRFAMTAMSTIFTTAISIMCTRITSTNMSSRLIPQIPRSARRKPAVHTSTTQTANTKRYRMVTTSITSSTAGYIIRMAITVMITGLWS